MPRARKTPARRKPPTRVKAPPILYKKTQAVLGRIQKKVDGTFLSYWTSTSGSVCDNDVLALHAILKATGPQDRIALLVKSDGGSGMASLRLVHLLRQYAKKLTVIAPLNCASAATIPKSSSWGKINARARRKSERSSSSGTLPRNSVLSPATFLSAFICEPTPATLRRTPAARDARTARSARL